MALYEDLVKKDVLRPTLQGFQDRKLKFTDDGKAEFLKHMGVLTPWVFAKPVMDRLCDRWFEIYFEMYNIVPRGCRNCWKISYRPENLTELFKVCELQAKMNKPSKCGVETRPISGNLGGYASFWYAPLTAGLRNARALQEEVRKLLVKGLSKDVSKKITLKRGCTEMEHFTLRQLGVGSDRWDTMAEQYDEVEKRAEPHLFDDPKPIIDQAEIMKVHTKMFWIERARDHGDKTYLNHSEEASWIPTLVDYTTGQVAMDFESTWKGE